MATIDEKRYWIGKALERALHLGSPTQQRNLAMAYRRRSAVRP